MLKATILKDPHGQNYRLRAPGDPTIQGKLDTKSFSNTIEAQSFIKTLDVPHGYWMDVVSRCGPAPANCATMEDHICDLLYNGQITLYKIKPQDKLKASAAKRTLKTNDGNRHQFTDASAEFDGDPTKLKRFSNQNEAKAYIEKLGPDQDQLKAIAESLEVSIPSNAATDSAAMTTAIAAAMAAGQVMIMVEKASATPKQETTSSEGVSNAGTTKMDSAAAVVETGNTQTKNTQPEPAKPICKRNTFKVTCSHGRSVELTPDTKHMPTLAIVSTTEKMLDDKKKQLLDHIIVESDIADICPDHKKGHLKTTDNSGEKIKHQVEGKKAKFNTPSSKQNLHTGFLKYLWLDNIQPRSFTVSPDACDQDKFKSAGSGIVVDVYPDIKMQANVQLGFGSASAKVVDDKDNPGQFKKELSQKTFALGGSVKLIQEDSQPELTTEFQNTIQDSISQLESVANTVEGILSNFDEGRKPSVEITWPNFALELETSLAEKKEPSGITTAFSFKVKANPFIKIEAKVDILPILMAPLLGGIVGKHIIENLLADLDKGWGTEEGWAHIRANAQIILSSSGELKGDFGFEGSEKTVTSVTGKPVEFCFKFEAKGEIKIDGHLLKVKIEVVAGIGITSSIDIGLQFKDDETGFYWQPTCLFNGIKVYIEGSIKGEKKTSGPDQSNGVYNPLANNTTAKAHPKEHIWIEPKPIEFDKRYIVQY